MSGFSDVSLSLSKLRRFEKIEAVNTFETASTKETACHLYCTSQVIPYFCYRLD